MPRPFPLEPDLQDPAPSYYPRTRLRSSTRPLCQLLSDDITRRRLSGHSEKTKTPIVSPISPLDAHVSCELRRQHDLSPTFSLPSGDISKEDHLQITTGVTFRDSSSGVGPVVQEYLKRRLASAFFAFFTLGWADGVTGTLLPHFEADLHLNYMSSSLFFVASATGYAVGTLLVEYITSFLGRYYLSAADPATADTTITSRFLKRASAVDQAVLVYSPSQSRFLTLVLASMLHAMFFVIMGSKRGFASMLVAYVISAFARSFVTGTLNMYISSTPKKALGYIYGTWAIGAFCAPLVCQSVIATGIPWAHFYLGSLVVSALNTSLIVFAFRPAVNELQRESRFVREEMKSHQFACTSPVTSDERSLPPSPDTFSPAAENSSLIKTAAPRRGQYMQLFLRNQSLIQMPGLRRTLKKPYLWTNSVFACLYTGTESSTQGYIVLYLLGTRSADPKTVGYVTSGFWGGMAISRLVWGYVSFRLSFTQRKWIVQSCIQKSLIQCLSVVIALSMHLLIWFVHSFVENAFSTAIIGMVYGPIYPSNLALSNDLMPVDLHMVSMAVIAAFASCGAALFPFITGTIFNMKGAHILPYITVAQTATMFCLWALFPSKHPRKENRQTEP
ncbi:MFS general substrate transporter [Amylocystis lapponica]|nr:MFS general substrate transporter [Amylocystis lapponica]